jgi:hypothetical protein
MHRLNHLSRAESATDYPDTQCMHAKAKYCLHHSTVMAKVAQSPGRSTVFSLFVASQQWYSSVAHRGGVAGQSCAVSYCAVMRAAPNMFFGAKISWWTAKYYAPRRSLRLYLYLPVACQGFHDTFRNLRRTLRFCLFFMRRVGIELPQKASKRSLKVSNCSSCDPWAPRRIDRMDGCLATS